MVSAFTRFQSIARKAHKFSAANKEVENDSLHPFDERNVHPEIDKLTRKLFDDGHYSQATFEAFKFIDKKPASLTCNLISLASITTAPFCQ